MALTSQTDRHALPCGRYIEDLWDRLDIPTSAADAEHERGCRHCQTARSSLLALANATRAVLDDTTLTPPAALRGRIMAAVRAEVRRGQRLLLPGGEFGAVDVSEQAVAVVLRFAADSVDGVRARKCRVGRTDAGAVVVQLSIAIRYDSYASIDRVDTVRARVVSAGTARIGLDISRVDVEVEDLYLEEG